MSKDDDMEIIPPRRGLPAKRPDTTPAPIGEVRRTSTGGVLNSMLTRWRGDHESRALDTVAKRNRSEADVIKSYGEVADSFENTSRKVNRLRKLPQILAMDDAKFSAEQEGEYHAINDEREERAHQSELAKRRRQRELAEADRQAVEARRGRFKSEQGLEKQERLKQLTLEIWDKRKETEHMEAEKILVLLQQEIDDIKPREAEGLAAQLKKTHAALVQTAIELAASGRAAEADRYGVLVVEIEKLIGEE